MVLQNFSKYQNYSKIQKAPTKDDNRAVIGKQTITQNPLKDKATRIKPMTDAEGLKQASLMVNHIYTVIQCISRAHKMHRIG